MLQDCKGMYLQPGMYVVYAAECADRLEQRIAKIIAIKRKTPRYGKPYSYLSVKSVYKNWREQWEPNNDGKAHALKNMDGVFAVPPSCIATDIMELLG